MLIGAHVSTAGGLENAIERGTDRERSTPRPWAFTRPPAVET